MMNDEAKLQILAFRKLEPVNYDIFTLKNDWNDESILKIVILFQSTKRCSPSLWVDKHTDTPPVHNKLQIIIEQKH